MVPVVIPLIIHPLSLACRYFLLCCALPAEISNVDYFVVFWGYAEILRRRDIPAPVG